LSQGDDMTITLDGVIFHFLACFLTRWPQQIKKIEKLPVIRATSNF